MRSIYNIGKDIGRFGNSILRKGGKIAKSVWENRDLAVKGAGILAPIIASGIVGGVPGVIGAGIAQQGELSDLKSAVKSRRGKLTRGGVVNSDDLNKAKAGGKKIIEAFGSSKKKIDSSRLSQLKQLAQGQML